ncbi:uncharacterized protein CLUP02_05528 [Colletotrichum lupini]|uniref:Uncharacterized protein n=3 Tax=Colletotrichum acutatum species complex TaxID=2707335 RepID=A0A9Q8WEA7_9PEZI|nr:uncharacterized protein CLUP02_05528 [Colletotrichum lupini]UQC80046.1 hypothetical protein CLUP02_05528 [Colletotrichum lupini]
MDMDLDLDGTWCHAGAAMKGTPYTYTPQNKRQVRGRSTFFDVSYHFAFRLSGPGPIFFFPSPSFLSTSLPPWPILTTFTNTLDFGSPAGSIASILPGRADPSNLPRRFPTYWGPSFSLALCFSIVSSLTLTFSFIYTTTPHSLHFTSPHPSPPPPPTTLKPRRTSLLLPHS